MVKPWLYDGMRCGGIGGRIVRVYEPRWWELGRWWWLLLYRLRRRGSYGILTISVTGTVYVRVRCVDARIR